MFRSPPQTSPAPAPSAAPTDPGTGASTRIPQHVAIIMDGNGRWAKARGLQRTAGHRKGIDAVKRTLEACREIGIRYLTLYSFSSENWSRPPDEIADLMGLLRIYMRSETANLHKNGIRLRVIGDRSRLDEDIVALIEQAESVTAKNSDYTLIMALSYGGRQEIVDTARRLARAAAGGELDPESIDEATFGAHTFTGGIPDPDLIIRTSGEKRISNFLLWQCAYAELVFLDTLWPDFTRRDLDDAIEEFRRRDRRYGATVGNGAG